MHRLAPQSPKERWQMNTLPQECSYREAYGLGRMFSLHEEPPLLSYLIAAHEREELSCQLKPTVESDEYTCSLGGEQAQVKRGWSPIDSPSSTLKTNRPIQKANVNGCKCSRTHCLKNYCPCHRGGQKCSQKCGCLDCCNRKNPLKTLKIKVEDLWLNSHLVRKFSQRL